MYVYIDSCMIDYERDNIGLKNDVCGRYVCVCV